MGDDATATLEPDVDTQSRRPVAIALVVAICAAVAVGWVVRANQRQTPEAVYQLHPSGLPPATYELRDTAYGAFRAAGSPFAFPHNGVLDAYEPDTGLADQQPLAWQGVSLTDPTHGVVVYSTDTRACALPSAVKVEQSADRVTITLVVSS